MSPNPFAVRKASADPRLTQMSPPSPWHSMVGLEFHTHDVSQSWDRPFAHTWLRNHLQSKQKRQPWAGHFPSALSQAYAHRPLLRGLIWSEGAIENRCSPSAYKIYTGNGGDSWKFLQLVEIWRQFPNLTLLQFFQPCLFERKKKKHKNLQENWEHMVLPPHFVERNVEKIRERLSEHQAWPSSWGWKNWLVSPALVPPPPPPHIRVTPVTLGGRTSGNSGLDARFTQFLFGK